MTSHALTHDPLRAVRDALEDAGCDPRGPGHKFTARCPAHEDRTPSLSVGEGVDGRALVYCFGGCDADEIVRTIGLQWADLFPPGHRNARPVRVLARQRAAIDLVLQALRELEIDYRATANVDLWVADGCPGCERRNARWPLWIQNDSGRVRLSCFNGCTQIAVLGALTGAEGSS